MHHDMRTQAFNHIRQRPQYVCDVLNLALGFEEACESLGLQLMLVAHDDSRLQRRLPRNRAPMSPVIARIAISVDSLVTVTSGAWRLCFATSCPRVDAIYGALDVLPKPFG